MNNFFIVWVRKWLGRIAQIISKGFCMWTFFKDKFAFFYIRKRTHFCNCPPANKNMSLLN